MKPGGREYRGKFTRMPRIAHDPETGRTWVCSLRVDMKVTELKTGRGETRVTESRDRIMVKSRKKSGGRYSGEISVCRGMKDAKMGLSISARNGRVCVAWCACDIEKRIWRVFATYSEDGKNWSEPVAVSGEKRNALNPSVALEPDTGIAWLAYEDWDDGSVRLVKFHGGKWSRPGKLSEGGRNFRPRIIVTLAEGKNSGAAAVAWDSYRNGSYGVYIRLTGGNTENNGELCATPGESWDSCPDIAEDQDGNLWVAWVRASNELGDHNAMRDIHARFYDGKNWLDPEIPDYKYSAAELNRAALLGGRKPVRDSIRKNYMARNRNENGGGRITWYSVNWAPKLLVDSSNRIHVFYRNGDPMFPPIIQRVVRRVYSGDTWSRPSKVNLGPAGAVGSPRDFSVTMTGKYSIEGVWEKAHSWVAKAPLSVEDIGKIHLKSTSEKKPPSTGIKCAEKGNAGWREEAKPVVNRTATICGKKHVLLFGDTHAHSSTSIGIDPPDYYFHYARDIAKLDFFALSENDVLFCGTPGTEAFIAFLPKIFSTKDFTCFQAHECVSSAFGHRVMVFEGDDMPFFPSGIFNSQRGRLANNAEHLYNFLHEYAEGPDSRVMVCPHNMINLGNDFSSYDPSLEPVYDVASVHYGAEKTFDEYRREGVEAGANNVMEFMLSLSRIPVGILRKRNPGNAWYYSYRQCLAAGLETGVYGASDSHISNALGNVLTGLWSAGRSRKDILDAVFARRTTAIDCGLRMVDFLDADPVSCTPREHRTPARLDVRFTLDENFTGAKCTVEKAPLLSVSARNLTPGDPVNEIIIIKNGKKVYSEKSPGDKTLKILWRDEKWKPGKHYYYVHVITRSGNEGYTSPVFTK